MKRVYSSPNSLLVHHMRNLLTAAGIETELRNEFLMGGAGDLPVLDCWPEIWVEEQRYAEAAALIAAQQGDSTGPAWQCAHCGTECEAQFDRCWQCGELRAG